MALYTVSINFLENLKDQDIGCFPSILFQFVNTQNPAKCVFDKKRIIVAKYREIRNHADKIKVWLDFVSYSPSSYEIIDTDLQGIVDNEELCLALCSKTKGTKHLIVHSISSFHSKVDDDNCSEYDGVKVKLIDKDEASLLINQSPLTSINNSVIVSGNADSINNCNNSNQ